MLRALRYPNYRLYFGGQIVSLVGSWITTTATSWLVYRLSGSAFLLGLSQLPFIYNFFHSLKYGAAATENPWEATSPSMTPTRPRPRRVKV